MPMRAGAPVLEDSRAEATEMLVENALRAGRLPHWPERCPWHQPLGDEQTIPGDCTCGKVTVAAWV